MPLLPALRGREVAAVFESLGWSIARQQGSHIIMTKKGSIATLAIHARIQSRLVHGERTCPKGLQP